MQNDKFRVLKWCVMQMQCSSHVLGTGMTVTSRLMYASPLESI